MESAKTQFELLVERIPNDKDIFVYDDVYERCLNQLLEDSKYIALSIRYPYKDYSDIPLPKKYYNWQLRCCEELYNTLGKENIVSYSENGVSWTRDSGNISSELYNEIIPMVGVINEIEE